MSGFPYDTLIRIDRSFLTGKSSPEYLHYEISMLKHVPRSDHI